MSHLFSLLLDVSGSKEFGAKVFLSCVSIAVALAMNYYVTRPGHRDSGALWARGERDSIRRIFFTQEGVLRQHARAGVLVWLIVGNILLWFFF